MATKVKPKPVTDPDYTQPILDMVRDVLPDPDLFLDTPNGAFDGQTPRHTIKTPTGELAVRQMVLAYKYGIFA